MRDWKRIVEQVRPGQIMPNTCLRGYSMRLADWDIDQTGDFTDEQLEDARMWLITEINNRLPDYAYWESRTSEIILPIDKVDDFEENVDWDELREEVWNAFVDTYEVK